ncbi:MAG: hypothetical protein LBH25_02205 [Fibromonadaceae bacterium]|nr:hypothetical protein [Fibromonadaceae bacterium]
MTGYFAYIFAIENGYWWSASEYESSYAYYRGMESYNEGAYWNYNYRIKSNLFSVRCLRD